MTLSKRILSMVAALSMISNNSVALGKMPSMIEAGLNDRSLGENADNEEEQVNDEERSGDETPTDEEEKRPDDEPTKDEDTTGGQEVDEILPPKLVIIPARNGDEWVTSLSDWSIRLEGREGLSAEVYYYAVPANGIPYQYGSKKLEPITSFDELPEGDYYVMFYARWKGSYKRYSTSGWFRYKLDKHKPNDFELELKQKEKYSDEIEIVSNEITDNASGIDKIYYNYSDVNSEAYKNLDDVEKNCTNITPAVDISEPDKKPTVNIHVTPKMKEKKVYVYAVDKCERVNVQSIYVSDADVPKIVFDGAINNYMGKELPAAQQNYGYDGEDGFYLTKYTYVNEDSFLKVKLDDENFDDCTIDVTCEDNEGNSQIISFPMSKVEAKSDGSKKVRTVYIPFSNLKLKNKGVYKFTIGVKDKLFIARPIDGESEYLYSTIGDNDALAEIKTVNRAVDGAVVDNTYKAILCDTEKDNILRYCFKDDISIAAYSIKITKGDETIHYKSKSIDDSVEKTIDFCGNICNYRIPVRETDPEDVELSGDGVYVVETEVKDIEGHIKKDTCYYAVDTEAPSIDKESFEIRNGARLNYIKGGVYSNKELVLSVNVIDTFSGVDEKDVKLYIETDDRTIEYSAHKEDRSFVFDPIKPEMSVDGSMMLDGKAYIVVKDKVGNSRTYYFADSKSEHNLSTDDNDVKLVIDTVAPTFTVDVKGSLHKELPENEKEKKQFFGKADDNALDFTFSDNMALKTADIIIRNKDGREVIKKELKYSSDLVLSNSGKVTIPIPNNLPDGLYVIDTEVTDVAGTVTKNPKNDVVDYPYFYVDKTAPTIDDAEYTVNKDSLNYKLFGIYGNETIDISISAKDNDQGCGIKEAVLHWGEKEYKAKIDSATGKLVFSGIEPNYVGVPYIVIKDQLDNENHYTFTPNSPRECVGGLMLSAIDENGEFDDNGILLMLEKNAPHVDIATDDSYTYIDAGGTKWFPGRVEYTVVAYDEGDLKSGISRVNVIDPDTNELIQDENSYGGKSFEDGRYTDTDPEYTYSIDQEGHYKLKASAEDNAGNVSYDNEEFYIDNRSPEITAFTLSSTVENSPFIHNGSYGYFFETDVTARVYVNDPDVSSGIKEVTLYTNEAGGNAVIMTMDAPMLRQDEKGTYAEFVIRKGFKGHIAAMVTDNVGHDSGKHAPDGTVIEDSQLHSEHAYINITPIGTPVNGFYNHPLALNVTVSDSFSGIADIDWSIGKDHKSGHMDTSVEDTTLSSTVDVGQQITATDANLITEVTFQLLVESDENDNPVNISMTDNAGNKLTASAMYSLDLTAPVVSSSITNTKAKNGIYYDADQTVNFTILERNFNAADAKVMVNGVEQKVSWQNGEGTGNNTSHTAKLDFKEDGDYNVTIQYTDLAGNPGTFDAGQHFIVDKTKPVITNNFADFKTGTPDDVSGTTELYYNNEDGRRAAFEVDVTEKNFEESDLHIAVYSKAPGSAHEEGGVEWTEEQPDFKWVHDEKKNTHKLTFDLNEDSVYKIEIDPEDRAGNAGDLKDGSETKTDIFEIDTTAPVLGARSDGDYAELTDDKYNALAVYDIDRFEDEAPFVEFEDTNLYRLEYELTTFKPEYSYGREIGEIVPEAKSADEDDDDYEKDKALEINKSEQGLSQDTIRFTVPDFEEDGVYSVTMYAVDMAGNKSEISENTFVRLMNTPLLAYIENSSKEEGTGWYSFEDEEYGPISKQPTSFEDLNIVMFSKAGTSPKLLLVDKDTEEEIDTGATAIGEKIIDDDLYMVDARRYYLPGGYFSANFTEDADTRLYLRAENDGEYIDLGEMYIDNTKPECAVPDYLTDWGWLKGSGDQTITFSNISEVLDDGETVVYINGEEITPDGNKISVDGKKVSAAYNVENDALSVTLPRGTYSIGAKLVDKAGNMRIITEVEHFSVGNTRIWYGVGGASALLLTIGGITAVVRRRRRKIN